MPMQLGVTSRLMFPDCQGERILDKNVLTNIIGKTSRLVVRLVSGAVGVFAVCTVRLRSHLCFVLQIENLSCTLIGSQDILCVEVEGAPK